MCMCAHTYIGASQVALVVKNLPASAGGARDVGSIPASGRSPGIGSGNPLQYSTPGKSHGQRNLVGYSPWGCKELDTTELLTLFTKCVDLKPTAPRTPRTVSEATRGCISARRKISLGGSGEMQW